MFGLLVEDQTVEGVEGVAHLDSEGFGNDAADDRLSETLVEGASAGDLVASALAVFDVCEKICERADQAIAEVVVSDGNGERDCDRALTFHIEVVLPFQVSGGGLEVKDRVQDELES